MPWHVHDPDRPHPRQIAPATTPGGAPSDATVLFDGTDKSHWAQRGRGQQRGTLIAPQVKLEGGYFALNPGTGNLVTRD
jgi:hypothetical protein